MKAAILQNQDNILLRRIITGVKSPSLGKLPDSVEIRNWKKRLQDSSPLYRKKKYVNNGVLNDVPDGPEITISTDQPTEDNSSSNRSMVEHGRGWIKNLRVTALRTAKKTRPIERAEFPKKK